MENEQEKTSAGDDHLNGDAAVETNDDAPTVDAADEKTEEQTKANGEKTTEEEEPSEALLAKIKTQVEVNFALHFHKGNNLSIFPFFFTSLWRITVFRRVSWCFWIVTVSKEDINICSFSQKPRTYIERELNLQRFSNHESVIFRQNHVLSHVLCFSSYFLIPYFAILHWQWK